MDGREEDWKDLLARDAQRVLADLLDSTRDHRAAFMQADDVKVAQLWTALVELKKELDWVKERVSVASAPFKTMVELADEEKRRALERMVRDIIKPTEPAQEEATRKLVDSLLKF